MKRANILNIILIFNVLNISKLHDKKCASYPHGLDAQNTYKGHTSNVTHPHK